MARIDELRSRHIHAVSVSCSTRPQPDAHTGVAQSAGNPAQRVGFNGGGPSTVPVVTGVAASGRDQCDRSETISPDAVRDSTHPSTYTIVASANSYADLRAV